MCLKHFRLFLFCPENAVQCAFLCYWTPLYCFTQYHFLTADARKTSNFIYLFFFFFFFWRIRALREGERRKCFRMKHSNVFSVVVFSVVTHLSPCHLMCWWAEQRRTPAFLWGKANSSPALSWGERQEEGIVFQNTAKGVWSAQQTSSVFWSAVLRHNATSKLGFTYAH